MTQKAEKPRTAGLLSSDAVQMMLPEAGWNLETGTPNWNSVASESLR
ncbi:MAG: hypothetical protein WCK04_06260 [Actinomycetes bacterium]